MKKGTHSEAQLDVQTLLQKTAPLHSVASIVIVLRSLLRKSVMYGEVSNAHPMTNHKASTEEHLW